MSQQVRYHQVYQIKIEFEEGNNFMTFLGDEQIYEERNAQGSAPPSQVFIKEEEEESSGDETPGTSDRSELEDRPPVEMPRGQLLSPEEAERHRGLFESQRRQRELFIRDVVQRLRPRVILLGRRRYLLQLYQDDVPSNSPDNVEIEFTLERESSSSSSSSSTSSLSSSSEDDTSDLDDSDSSDSSDSSDTDDREERRGAKRRRLGSHSSEGRRGKKREVKSSNSTRNSSDSYDED